MVLAGAVIASLMVGFLAGLISFKHSQQFCTKCGVTKMCLICVARRGSVHPVNRRVS